MPRRILPSIWNHRFLPRNLPQKHVIAVTGLSLALMMLIGLGDEANNTTEQRAGERRALALDIPQRQTPPTAAPPSVSARPLALIAPTASKPTPSQAEAALTLTSEKRAPAESLPKNQTEPSEGTLPRSEAWQTVTVRNGDSLSKLFQRVGLSDRDLHQILKNNEEARGLRRLYPGQELAFHVEGGALQALRHIKSPLETLFITRQGDAFQSSKDVREPEVRQRFAHAVISDNLFQAGARADLSHGIIMELANVFSGVIDFVYDPRRGDAFSVLYEELYLDGKKYQDGKIIAAHFTNQGTDYPAFFYTSRQGGTGYYNAKGVSMRKAFLRAPVDFTRISSNFNPARRHPIFKTKRPHRGIDYAAKRGTPVFATGKGRVSRAGYTAANGNYVVIAHGDQFLTKYLHLHKKQVKQGQRVKQGQIIGQVGSTGYATGPHLHYEFLLNGVHRNPRTIHKKLPKARSIPNAELARFQATIAPLEARINEYHKTQVLASRSASADGIQ